MSIAIDVSPGTVDFVWTRSCGWVKGPEARVKDSGILKTRQQREHSHTLSLPRKCIMYRCFPRHSISDKTHLPIDCPKAFSPAVVLYMSRVAMPKLCEVLSKNVLWSLLWQVLARAVGISL